MCASIREYSHLHSAGVIDGALRLLSSVKMDDLPALVRFLTQVLARPRSALVLGAAPAAVGKHSAVDTLPERVVWHATCTLRAAVCSAPASSIVLAALAIQVETRLDVVRSIP